MKHFYKTLKLIYKLEQSIQTENQPSYDNILNQLKSIKHTSEGTFKRWNDFVNNLRSNIESKNNELLGSWVEEYINFVSNEINEFDLSWNEHKNKIKDMQNILNDSYKKLNDNSEIKKNISDINRNKDNEEFKENIKEAIKFIKNNINNIRLREKSKMQYFKGKLEKMIISFKMDINKIIDKLKLMYPA